MTNDRLNEILDEQKIVRYRGRFLKAMKQAVNEAYDNAAFHEQVTDGEYVEDELFASEPNKYWVDKQSILNLKVK